MAPSSEALVNSYPADKIQSIAIDVWDGGELQVNIFVANSGINHPILMYGGQAGILSDYNCSYDYFFIVGGDGLIKWRGFYDEAAMVPVIDAAVAELSTSAVPDVPAGGHKLMANYPNPFNPMTRIPYELGDGTGNADVQLQVVDLRGRVIKTLVQDRQASGQAYEALWDGTNSQGRQVPSGTYLYRLRVDGVPQSRMLTLVK